MKSFLPLLSLALIFASCSTAYKTGQTPDDVYYSPTRPQSEYVRADEEDEDEVKRYKDEEEYRNDRYLRMRVRNRRWYTIDDEYAYSYYPSKTVFIYNSPWNTASYWNYYNNPYCCCNTGYLPPVKATVYSTPRKFNLNVYNQPTQTNVKGTKVATRSTTTSSSGSSSSGGGLLRTIFGGSSSGSSSGSSGSGSVKGSSSSGSSSTPPASRGNARRS
jgi:hypothetical protein